MSFLDKAKEKATQLTQQAKEKVDDLKDSRRADSLLEELGRIVFRQHTDRAEPADDTRLAELVAELRVLEDEGTPVLGAPPEPPVSDLAPPTPPLPAPAPSPLPAPTAPLPTPTSPTSAPDPTPG
jgi:hypothetical protein